jgi:FRG domain
MPTPSDWSHRLREFLKGWKSGEDDYLGDRPFDSFVLTEQASSWEECLAWITELQGAWCFWGQRDARWYLNTSLDRAVKKEFSSPTSSGYYHLDREAESRELLFRFQQQAHQYIPALPAPQDLSSWFALMQHHGVPTRFLDWTKSAYVAMYFAFEEEPPQEGCAVWAIDLDWLEKKACELLPEAPLLASDDHNARAECVNGLLSHTEKPVILRIDPLRLDARMVGQQGFFLCKLFHQATFSIILMGMMSNPKVLDEPTIPDHPVVRRLVLKRELRITFLKNLRAMNIHRASLFPGLDGFGQSFRLDLEMKVKA